MIEFVAGLFVGSTLGVIVMALFAAGAYQKGVADATPTAYDHELRRRGIR